ncbi:LYR motif-containing protein 1 [Phytophthora cinnamomi]|uniref:LYR motif-containing protein 1 n=1 Tax=Phytophthora cinnamomi TaxID=4785 RepID=UPI00355AB29F|nr:LYR motif-containing protein 1 [Phytophthora cinnamomi]
MSLSLYRRILRVARTWEGGAIEQDWIRAEARRRFEENRSLTGAAAIEEAVRQGHNQVDVALHYKICYPRPQYVDPGTMGGESDFRRQSSRANTRLGRLHKSKLQSQFRRGGR